MTKTLIIVGASGHGRELCDIADATGTWSRVCVVDDDPSKRTMIEARGATFLGALADADLSGAEVAIGIGSEMVRARIDADLTARGASWATLIHPAATVGSVNEFGPGVVLFPGARVTTNVTLGRHVHLNVNASVSHDCRVGDHSTVSPGAVVAGACRIGARVLIGAGATVLQNRRIGDDARVGAGAVVADDVAPEVTVVGVPARPIGPR